MAFTSITGNICIFTIDQFFDWLAMFAWYFQTKTLLYLFVISYWPIQKHFYKLKRPHTHLLMRFSSIRIMVYYIFYHQNSSCRVTGSVCLVFSAKSLLYSLSTCYSWSMENVILGQWKTLFSQKDLILIYRWSLPALQKWLLIFLSPKMNFL